MFAAQYYYFVTGLPNLGYEDAKAAFSPASFMKEAAEKLNNRDMKLLQLLYLPDDLQNLLTLVYDQKREWIPDTPISREDWEELIAFLKPNPDNDIRKPASLVKLLPAFVSPMIKELLALPELPKALDWESKLFSAFYEYATHHRNRYVRSWFTFNRDMQNVLIAINGRKYEYNYAPFLMGEGEVVEKLARSTAADFGLGKQYPLYETLYRIYDQYGIVDRERNYDALRWRWIDSQNFFEYFNIDRILGYFCKLRIQDRWLKLDVDSGKEIFFDTLNALENSFSFPEEFDLKQKVKQ